jgi:uncharacterized damage-inducible protein DinB
MSEIINQQLIETWQINNRVNMKLLDGITDEGLEDTLSKRGGRTVALQFAHLHNVRLGWLEVCAKDLLKGQTKIDTAGEVGKALLKKRLTESGEAIGKLIAQGVINDGKIKGYKRGIVPMIGYLVAHDAHHRGNMLLTLKQCGHKLTQQVQFGIWDWEKI